MGFRAWGLGTEEDLASTTAQASLLLAETLAEQPRNEHTNIPDISTSLSAALAAKPRGNHKQEAEPEIK